jgi:NADPH-dependent curcumin reductase CurA
MLLLAARPVGDVKQSDFELVEAPIPEPGPGEFVAEVTDISLDPAMRSWMNAGRSYIPPVQIGDVMRAYAIGRVIASRHDGFVAGDLVHGLFGVQEFALSDGAGVLKIEPTDGIPRTAHLGVLGLTGMTAYFGLLDVGRFEAGQTVLVSGAAGAVGMTVGQIAKIKGGTAVGIAGGTEKCRLLVEELGFDAAIDYKAGDLLAQMRERTPDRVDVFFDNVGGTILDAGLTRIGHGGRLHRLRLRRPLPRRRRRPVALADRRPAHEHRAPGPGRHRGLPRRLPAPVRWPEHRQARPRDQTLMAPLVP